MPSTSNFPSPSKSPPLPDPSFLESLNEEQRAAVCTPGPVLVLAGAGTGKTRVIAHRLAYLLTSVPGLRPANVLALTFSRKAAAQMHARAESLYGERAAEMRFQTFHGFCHRFLEEHARQLGLPARFRMLDQAESWVFFRSLLPQLRPEHHFSVSDPTACIEGFLRFIGRAKDELVSPAECASFARRLPDARRRERGEEAARVYGQYQRRMREAGNLDFGDLVAETVRALQARPALLRAMRARYRCILVDEFQDTNVAQIELLRLLAGPGVDLCVVGDDDQAIYRFRGASFASFWLMRKAFPGLRHVRLTRNYRATPALLEAGQGLIRHNAADRYDPDKRLWTENPDGPPVEVVCCGDDLQEAAWVAARVRQLHEAEPLESRRWDRICVLYRAHAHRDRLVGELRRTGIPFSVRGGDFLLQRPEIRDLVAFLRALEDPQDSLSLFRLLNPPGQGFPPEEWRGVPLSERARSEWGKLQERLERFRAEARRLRVEELVPRLVEETFPRGFPSWPEGSVEDPQLWVDRFLRVTRRYAELYPKARDVGSFLWYVDSLARAPSADFAEEEAAPPGDRLRLAEAAPGASAHRLRLAEAAPGASAHRLRLMTVHQAKGLEFEWVILLGLVQGRFPTRPRREPVPFPVELMKEPLPEGDYQLQEERRLCYVACTRARRGLILMTQDRARRRMSLFLREILQAVPAAHWLRLAEAAPGASAHRLQAEEVPEGLPSVAPALPGRVVALPLAPAALPPSSPAVRLPVEGPFSYSQLESYRACPQRYVYAYLYRIPVPPSPPMQFGTDLHACLEDFLREVMQGGIPPLKALLGSFARLHAPGRYGEPYQDSEYLRLGERMLRAFYGRHGGRFPKPLFVERPFTLPLGDASIRGVVDRVDPLPGGGVEIIDYKSGRPREGAAQEERLQLRLYALAVRDLFSLEPRRVSFHYLREDRLLSFEQKPEDFDRTREEILQGIQRIRSGDFAPTPSIGKCRRCDFRSICPASLA